MKIALADVDAFGETHLDGLKSIGGVGVVSLVDRRLEQTRAVAVGFGHACTEQLQA